jgi:MFS family permease
LRHRQILTLLFSANTVSSFAQGITMIAIPWYLLQMPDGKWLNATLVATVTLVSMVWGLYAGALIDRYNRKHIFLTFNAIDALVLGCVAGYGFWAGGLPFALIALVYGCTIFTYNIHFPNVYAFVQELFEPSAYGKVNSALEVQHQTTSFLGMMVGSLLLDGAPDWAWWPDAWQFAPWALHEIFLMDGSTYLLALWLISQIPYQPAPGKQVDRGKAWVRIRQGLAYLSAHRPLLIFGLASYVVFFALLVVIQVAMPVYVMDHLQAQAAVLSSFKGVYSLGAVAAGLLGFSVLFKRGHLIRQVMWLVSLAGIMFLVLALTQSVLITLVSAFALGVANAGTRILRITYLVRMVPNHVIGRVNAFFTVANVFMRVSFIGVLTLPFFSAPANGGHIVLAFGLLAGCMFIAAAVIWWRFPSFDERGVTDAQALPQKG